MAGVGAADAGEAVGGGTDAREAARAPVVAADDFPQVRGPDPHHVGAVHHGELPAAAEERGVEEELVLPGPHPIQGLGANFIPSILNAGMLDGIIDVDAEKSKEMARRAAREEGLLVGISSGAALAGVEAKLPEFEGKRILTFNYDTGERYLSVPGFLPE